VERIIPGHVPAGLVQPLRFTLPRLSLDDPFETMIPEVHNGPAVFYAPDAKRGTGGGWVPRRAEDMRAIWRDTQHFTNKAANLADITEQALDFIPVELDPPRHQDFRDLLNPLFAPRKMVAMEEHIRDYARRIIRTFQNSGRAEIIEAFAIPFPVSVFLELVDLPQSRMRQFLEWEAQFLRGNDHASRVRAMRDLSSYLLGILAKRRMAPQDDYLSYIATAQVEGRQLRDDEFIGLAITLFIGGLDTITSMLSFHLRYLATDLNAQAALRADRSLIVPAAEEMMRAFASSSLGRLCVEPVQIGGVDILPGDYVLISTPLAARDPELYPDPGKIDFARSASHTTFGAGIHRCIGMHLARREIQIAIEELLDALPPFRIAPDFAVQFNYGTTLAVPSLPLVW
jgi:cytochrome P450